MLFWIYLADMPIFNVLSSAGSRIALVSQIQSGREEKGRERARERERGALKYCLWEMQNLWIPPSQLSLIYVK